MAISDTITSMYENVGEVYDTLTNVEMPTNKNIENIPSTIRKSYLNIMNNGYQDIWDSWDKVNGSGTSLSLNNTEEAPMSLTYKGNTSQNGTPTPTSPIPVQVVSGDNSIEVVGKNLVDNSILELFSSNKYVKTPNYNTKGTIMVRPNTTYTFSTQNTSFTDINVYEFDKNNNRTTLVKQAITPQHAFWFTTSATAKTISFYSNNNGLEMPSNLDFQIEVGNQATTYEEYKSASYNIDLESSNLFDMSSVTFGYRLDTTGKDYVDSSYFITPFIPVKASTQYIKNSPSEDALHRVAFYTSANQNDVISVGTSNSFTTPSSCKYLRFCGSLSEIFTTQLNKGNTVLPYQEYFTPIELCKIGTYQDKIDKSTGKNLFDAEEGQVGYVKNDGTIGNDSSNYASDYIYLGQNTDFTISANQSMTNIGIAYFDNSKAIILPREDNSNKQTVSKNTGNAYYVRFWVQKSGATMSASAVKETYQIMLNEGTTALPYEPYGTGWYLKKEIGKADLGELSWATTYNIGDGFRLCGTTSISNIKYASVNTELIPAYAEKYIERQGSGMSSVANRHHCAIDTTRLVVHLETDVNPTGLFYYPLATPTYEYITDTTLISQLEEAKKSYEEQTNISQTNNDLPFELDVEALQKM